MKLAFVLLLAATGCASPAAKIAEMMKQLKDDNATFVVGVNSLSANVRIVRIMPATNMTVTASPDGTVTVKKTE
jgi:outer membrane lipoprotein-sorting protein